MEWRIFTATAASLTLLALFPLLLRSRTEGMLHPHGYCYVWDPALVWSHVSADALIGAAYVAISLTLAYLVYRVRHLLPFHWMFLAFGLFILTCGATHFMDVWTLWFADFWASAALKIVTAVASMATAVALPPLVPQVVRLLQSASVSEQRATQLARERKSREAAEAESRAKDLFLATLSHELRTPLNVIGGWTQMLEQRLAGDVAMGKILEAIQRNVLLQTRLVEDMLDVSSIVTGRLQLQRRPVDIVDVARQAADAANHAALGKGLRIESSLPAHPVAVDGDPARLQQIVSNLLSNAIKFTDSGGHISLRVERDGHTALVTVQDTGIGISRELLPRIFDAFVQADQSSTRAAGGLGLGLALVRYLAEAHDGSVTAASDGLGQGSTFVVRLPAAP